LGNDFSACDGWGSDAGLGAFTFAQVWISSLQPEGTHIAEHVACQDRIRGHYRTGSVMINVLNMKIDLRHIGRAYPEKQALCTFGGYDA